MYYHIIERIYKLIANLKSQITSNERYPVQNLDEITNIENDLHKLDSYLKYDYRNMARFKYLNITISIVPAVIATLLTFYVFSLTARYQGRFKQLQQTSKLKDSSIKTLNTLIVNQDSIIKIYSRETPNYIPDSNYLKKSRSIQELRNQFDSLKIKIIARDAISE